MPGIASMSSIETPAMLAVRMPVAPGRITVRHVLKVTAEHYGTTRDALVSDRKTQPLVRQRQVAMYVAHEMTGRGLPFIAYYMGNRHHTTILHGVRAVRNLLDAGNAETIAAVVTIMERLRGTGSDRTNSDGVSTSSPWRRETTEPIGISKDQQLIIERTVMSYRGKLKARIDAQLDALQAAHLPMIPRWVTYTICTDHESALAEDNEHSDFWRHSGYMHTRRMVTEYINKRGNGTNNLGGTRQRFKLPGFEHDHLQNYYVVDLDGETVVVCILDMTDEELEAKASRHEAIAAADAAHAQEIRRFIVWRKERGAS
jgi:hypothetical protein